MPVDIDFSDHKSELKFKLFAGNSFSNCFFSVSGEKELFL